MKDHLIYYILLSSILILGISLVIYFQDVRLKILILCATALIYSLMGIAHHLKNHNLVAKIVIEYILVAALGVAVAFFIFKGGFGF